MDTFNCNECSKTFTKEYNLKRHIKSVHEQIKPHQCGICSKSFSRKLHRDYHLRTCSQNVCSTAEQVEKSVKEIHQLKFTPIHHSSGFGGVATEWYIYYPEEYRLCDTYLLLETSALSMKDAISKQLYERTKRLKYHMSIHIVFTKAINYEIKTDPPVVLHTNPTEVYPCTDLEGCLIDDAKDLYQSIENYEGVGSGWVIDYLVRLDTGIFSF